MKNGLKNLLKFSAFIVLTLFLVLKVGEVFIPETGDKKMQGGTYTIKGFYELPKNSIDVMFVGDSTLLNGISPMEMWNDAGIASYNYSASSVRMVGLYHMLQEVLKTQKPKIVVIDPDTMFYYYKVNEPHQRAHMNYLSNSKVKYDLVNEPFYQFSFEDKVSAFIPLLRYHSRWNEFKFNDLKKLTKDYSSVTRGYVMAGGVKPSKRGDTYMLNRNDKIKYENDSLKYLNKIYDLCKEKGITLLLVQAPNSRDWGLTQHEKIEKFANEHNINFLDFNTVDFGLNWNTDTKDGGPHMNTVGALKVTSYLTKYLKEHYDLKDHRGEAEYDFWNDDYKKYKNELEKYIKIINATVKK